MPISTVNTCTQEAVLEALRACGGCASYETDSNESLAHTLGFDKTQVNTMFHHLKRLSAEGKVHRSREDVAPRRLHCRGPHPAIVRRVTFTIAAGVSLSARTSETGRGHSPYFVR